MNHCLQALASTAAPKILVTVATASGSVPREAGAKMLVTEKQIFDTIGGGHLEMRAIETARAMLAMPAGVLLAERRLERFPLGPSLGQCCGGVVHLAFERITDQLDESNDVLQRWRSGEDTWRVLALDNIEAQTLCGSDGAILAGPGSDLGSYPPLPVLGNPFFNATHVTTDIKGQRWLVDAWRAYHPHLMVFGAGHVGTAIVRALADLPCRVSWVDEREDLFLELLPSNVQIEASDTPEALVDSAAPGSCFLVLTHNHALDQLLSEHILRRFDFAWFGLIGSHTKRMQFEHRLHERGIPLDRFEKMVCPIGLPGIEGKSPPVIAAAVAAQLLQVWQALEELQ